MCNAGKGYVEQRTLAEKVGAIAMRERAECVLSERCVCGIVGHALEGLRARQPLLRLQLFYIYTPTRCKYTVYSIYTVYI